MSLAGKIALVTGGGGGIGSAISRRLAEAGATVVLTYSRSAAQTQAVAESLPGEGHLVIQASVDDSAAQATLARQITQTFGTLDMLVNNAGITQPVPHDDLDSLTDDLIDEIFRVNWRGAFASVRAMKPLLMNGGGGGLIVNISSIAGRTGVGSNVAYCASKAALDSMTRSLARALAPEIRVLSVSPGFVDGDYARRMPDMVAAQESRTPLQRIATSEDVAEAVYVAAAHLKFSTGDIIPVDGGRPLG